MQSNMRCGVLALASILAVAQLGNAADHGPVFGLATPTNPEGGLEFRPWSQWARRNRFHA